MPILRFILAVLLAVAALVGPLSAQQARLACGQGLVQNQDPVLRRAAIRQVALATDRIPIRFVGHSTFLIQSPQGVNVITDYNDYYRAGVRPDIATMNTNRANHSTFTIEPGVTHALYGWDTGDGIPHHDVTFKDVRVYSEPTNITALGNRMTNETAIFVIQVGGMCIAHLGHTAHILDEETVKALGAIDIALTPVDRVVTASYEEIFHNIQLLKPRVIIPMHDIGWGTQQFVAEAARLYPIKRDLGETIEVSRDALPRETEVWVLQPRAGRYGNY